MFPYSRWRYQLIICCDLMSIEFSINIILLRVSFALLQQKKKCFEVFIIIYRSQFNEYLWVWKLYPVIPFIVNEHSNRNLLCIFIENKGINVSIETHVWDILSIFGIFLSIHNDKKLSYFRLVSSLFFK